MALKKSEKLEMAKKIAIEGIITALTDMSAEQVDDFAYAIPVEIEGEEKWCKISLVAKDTMTDANGEKVPYDPFIEQEMWQDKLNERKVRKEEQAKKKAETLKRAEERKARAKAKAEARKAGLVK